MLEGTFLAPAKINLCLHVLGRRLDGYHELAMAMQRVDLCDHIRIRVEDGDEIRVSCAGVALTEGEENIAAKAARLLLDELNRKAKVSIVVDKRIPVAAGLGGGSSNAAAVLTGLLELFQLSLPLERLLSLAAKLGADVPFFLFGQPAWATGVGTELQPLPPLPDVAYLLVNPKIAVSTGWVYQSLQLTPGGDLANLPRFSVVTREDLCARLHNDLERVTLPRFPVIAEIKERLLAEGASGALMSGSGSTVFGVFADFASATRIGEKLQAESDWIIHPVHPLRTRD